MTKTETVLDALSVDDIAGVLAIPRSAVVRFVKDGELRAFSVSLAKKKPRTKDWRILSADLREWQQRRMIVRRGRGLPEMVEVPPYRGRGRKAV